MKGIVFTEFLDFVAEQFSLEMLDDIIQASDLPSEGAYTAVGTYDYQEMIQLVSALSRISGLPVADLVASFGQHLFGVFVNKYPGYIEGIDSTFSFLLAVEKTIHVEVLKLYPDAELPRFQYEFPEPDTMLMIYKSRRALGDLAEGLMRGCIEHFGDSITIQREDMPPGDGTAVRFLLTRGQ
ncbi:MAG: hypothetical protein GY696_19600 [Gammaproteobacteria bacterium]|nr:hypothetical protein [Gammaproteobacteria bacterium]